MAKKTRTVTEYNDDIEGKPFSEGEGESLTFAFDGKSYEIDLNTKNAKKMREAMAFYINHARPAASPSAVTRGRATAAPKSPAADYDLADVRSWAASNGIEVAERGRIKSAVLDRYRAERG